MAVGQRLVALPLLELPEQNIDVGDDDTLIDRLGRIQGLLKVLVGFRCVASTEIDLAKVREEVTVAASIHVQLDGAGESLEQMLLGLVEVSLLKQEVTKVDLDAVDRARVGLDRIEGNGLVVVLPRSGGLLKPLICGGQ